jgi:hypothetical protein
MMSILPDSRKVFWEMSKQMSAKRQHDEAAKFSGPDNQRKRNKRRESEDENDTTTNEKPRDADA